MVGNSLTHGAHHVAHRLTSTGLPLNAAIETSLPAGSLKAVAGRGLALAAAVDALAALRFGSGRLRRLGLLPIAPGHGHAGEEQDDQSQGYGTGNSNQMWGGRFAGGPAAVMREINASIAIDKRLWREDIAASRAHAAMLGQQGILSEADARAIDDGLAAVACRDRRRQAGRGSRARGHPHARRASARRIDRRGRGAAPHRAQPQRPGRDRLQIVRAPRDRRGDRRDRRARGGAARPRRGTCRDASCRASPISSRGSR